MRGDKAARAYDPRIKEVRSSYADELRHILVIGSDGTFAEDSQPLARMNVGCIAKDGTNSARGTSGGGGRVALDFFFGEKTPEYFAKESARQAILQLMRAKLRREIWKWFLVPAGREFFCMKLWVTGWKLISIASRPRLSAGLIGKQVASSKCTVVDNGTMPLRRGSLNVDDEGNTTQETVLIENGTLKNYLSDKLSASSWAWATPAMDAVKAMSTSLCRA